MQLVGEQATRENPLGALQGAGTYSPTTAAGRTCLHSGAHGRRSRRAVQHLGPHVRLLEEQPLRRAEEGGGAVGHLPRGKGVNGLRRSGCGGSTARRTTPSAEDLLITTANLGTSKPEDGTGGRDTLNRERWQDTQTAGVLHADFLPRLARPRSHPPQVLSAGPPGCDDTSARLSGQLSVISKNVSARRSPTGAPYGVRVRPSLRCSG